MPPIILLLVATFGAVLGSFGNVLIFRLPKGRTLGGRSKCPHCGHTLRWNDLVPVFSYLALLGRCRTCRKPISSQYPLVESASAGLAVLSLFIVPSLPLAPILFFALWLLLLLAVIDGRTGTVPDALSIPFIALSILFALLREPLAIGIAVDLALAILIGAGFFGAQWIMSRGRWVGSGDIFIAAGIAALLGSPVLAVIAIGMSYILGALFAVVLLLLRQKTLASHLAFGPFLACGGLLTLLWGEEFLRILRII